MRSERRQIREPDDLSVGLLAVAPDHLGEFERERPLDVGRDRPLPSRALHARRTEISTSPEVAKKVPFFRLLTIGAQLSPVSCPSGLKYVTGVLA